MVIIFGYHQSLDTGNIDDNQLKVIFSGDESRSGFPEESLWNKPYPCGDEYKYELVPSLTVTDG
jgi:hypothetical protein